MNNRDDYRFAPRSHHISIIKEIFHGKYTYDKFHDKGSNFSRLKIISAGLRNISDNVTQFAIKNKIRNCHREKLSSRNTSDVSSAIYGGEKVGRVSQRKRRYLQRCKFR